MVIITPVSLRLHHPVAISNMFFKETIAGAACHQSYKPSVSPDEFPVLDTRPLSSLVREPQYFGQFATHPYGCFVKEMDLIGLEDDPDFWNMGPDSGSVEETSEPKLVDTQGLSCSCLISLFSLSDFR